MICNKHSKVKEISFFVHVENFFSDQEESSKGDNKKKKGEGGKAKSKEPTKKQHAGKKQDSGKQPSNLSYADVDSSSTGKIDKRLLTSEVPTKNPMESDSVNPICQT